MTVGVEPQLGTPDSLGEFYWNFPADSLLMNMKNVNEKSWKNLEKLIKNSGKNIFKPVVTMDISFNQYFVFTWARHDTTAVGKSLGKTPKRIRFRLAEFSCVNFPFSGFAMPTIKSMLSYLVGGSSSQHDSSVCTLTLVFPLSENSPGKFSNRFSSEQMSQQLCHRYKFSALTGMIFMRASRLCLDIFWQKSL